MSKIQFWLNKDKQTFVWKQEEAWKKMWCLVHKLVDFGENIFADVFIVWMIEEQLFGLLELKVLVDLNMLENVFMLGWFYGKLFCLCGLIIKFYWFVIC